jgi:hypothetical protein
VSAPYSRAGGGGTFQIPGCGSGETRTKVGQTSTTSDGRSVKSPLPTTLNAPVVPSGYPECQPAGACTLVLTRHAQQSGEQVASTAVDAAPFRQWQTKTTTSTSFGTRNVTLPDGSLRNDPRRGYPDATYIECRLGVYLVPYGDCESIPTEAGSSPQAETQESYCQLSDFSFNPMSWVVVPLRCLFIPPPGSLNGTATTLKDTWGSSPPGVVLEAVTGVFTPFLGLTDSTAGCSGPTVSMSMPLYGEMPSTPFSTCNPLATWLLGYALPIESVLIYAASLFGGSRILTRTLGAESA